MLRLPSTRPLAAAGLKATESGSKIRLASTNGTLFQLTVDNSAGIGGDGFGFGTFAAVTTTSTLAKGSGFLETTFNSGGADASTTGDVTSYADIVFGGDDQTLTITG